MLILLFIETQPEESIKIVFFGSKTKYEFNQSDKKML